jgi:hypothetical protein
MTNRTLLDIEIDPETTLDPGGTTEDLQNEAESGGSD